MAFDFTAYMKGIAETLKDIRHSDSSSEKRFFRISSVMNIDEMLQNFTTAGSACIMVEDNRTGRYQEAGGSMSYLDNQSYSFLIMKHCEQFDAESREQVKKDCEAIMKKIISKFKKDKAYDLQHPGETRTGMRDFNMSTIYYQTIGPVGDNYYGMLVQFARLEPVNADLVYNDNDWTNG